MKDDQLFIFDSFNDYLNAATGEPTMEGNDNASHQVGIKGGVSLDKWTGTATFEEALKLAEEGWPEGRGKADGISNVLFEKIVDQVEKEEVVYDVEGQGVDVARYLDNEPECWNKFELVTKAEPAIRRLVSVVLNRGSNSFVSTKVIMQRGAALFAVVKLLEYSGHRVEIKLGFCTKKQYFYSGELGKTATTIITIKKYDQDINEDILAYTMIHPSMQRRIQFGFMETWPIELRKQLGVTVSEGYGSSTGLPSEFKGDISLDDCDAYTWSSEAETKKWIIKTLKSQGVTLHDSTEVKS